MSTGSKTTVINMDSVGRVLNASITLNRAEAEDAMRQINELRRACVSNIAAYKRKRSWRPAEVAMAVAGMEMRLRFLVMLHERIGTAFNLGGH